MDHQNPNLSDEQQYILFDQGTETPGTGKYLYNKREGIYVCANCSSKLFSSDTKYDSTTPGLIGWPGFSEAVTDKAVKLKDDNKLWTKRTEVICGKCGGHLGHLFPDESSPNGKHYCINSLSLDFKPESKGKEA